MHHRVTTSESSDDKIMEKDLVKLDFGEVYINQKKKKSIFVHNDCQFNFDFMIKSLPHPYI